MSVKDFELYHGIVLTKMIRSDHPVSLRMIERNRDEAWSAYRINDEINLYIKYRTRGRKTTRPKGMSWNFIFGEDELRQINSLKSQKPVYLALVCAEKKVTTVCFLEPDEIDKCMNLNEQAVQHLTVLYQQAKSLRAYGPRNSSDDEKLVIPQNRLDKWSVPGT